MPMRRICLVLACIAALVLAGCGFHPRGALVVPDSVGPVKVIGSDPYSPLTLTLSHALTRAHAQPATDPKAPSATLRIVSETWDQQPLTINAHAQATEYYVTYVVKFAFTAADGKDIEPLQEVRLQRDYAYDIANALGAAQEQQTIREEMQHDMAAAIMRRIGIALRHVQP
ncbi:MAG: hypothetical protein JSR34_03270 [Proteobacteria bacterium]|nr:hypothetical protein [Pseudomonadota bacterium]